MHRALCARLKFASRAPRATAKILESVDLYGLRSAVNIPPRECYLDWPGDQYRNPKAEDGRRALRRGTTCDFLTCPMGAQCMCLNGAARGEAYQSVAYACVRTG